MILRNTLHTPREDYHDGGMKVEWIATALFLFALASGQPPMPTPDQVAWLDREVGALFQFNIGEYGTVSVCLCIIRPNPHYM